MKLTTILLLALIPLTAQAQNTYDEAIQQGDAALRRGEYKTAIKKYFAAEAFDPSKKTVVQGKVNAAFDKIEALRVEEEASRKQVQEALAQVKAEQEKTQQALADTERAKLQAEGSLQKANKLIDAFYFYEGRFALAFKNWRYYFIDKNGDPIEKLGTWERVEHFDGSGLAKVKKSEDPRIYLLDTLGNVYTVAYDIKDLGPEITALDLSGDSLERFPWEIFQHPQLRILSLSDIGLVHLPPEIGLLQNLTRLELDYNYTRRKVVCEKGA